MPDGSSPLVVETEKWFVSSLKRFIVIEISPVNDQGLWRSESEKARIAKVLAKDDGRIGLDAITFVATRL